MDFRSDNVSGAHPAILEAIAAANRGPQSSYGADAVTARVSQAFRDLFETDCVAFPVATGTAANALALACMTPPFGAIYCHREAHIEADECGAPEFFTGGAKLVLLDGLHAKFDAGTLEAALAAAGPGVQHHVQPAAVSLTQATERGAAYKPDEIAAIAELAHARGLTLHMDGARFANAVATLDCAPADLSWRAGVDALSFGATKNGALAAEAVIFFKPELAREFVYRRKRAGHLVSKMRFVSAQLEAYLKDGLWLGNARHANAMARRLAAGLEALPGVRLADPVEANALFAELPERVRDRLERVGFKFHRWGAPPEAVGGRLVRLVTAFDTDPEQVDALVAAAKGLA